MNSTAKKFIFVSVRSTLLFSAKALSLGDQHEDCGADVADHEGAEQRRSERKAVLECFVWPLGYWAMATTATVASRSRNSHPTACETLALDELVRDLVYTQHRVRSVVEDEIAVRRSDRQDGVPLAGLINNHRHPHCASQQASLDQELALEELVVFAVSLAVRRQVPMVDLAPDDRDPGGV